jgi:hypothetical protein
MSAADLIGQNGMGIVLDLSAWRELVVTLSNSGRYTESYLL